MDKLLTIGIPTHNRAAYLDTCLGELLNQIQPFNELIEIQVADNASSDGTKLVVEKYQKIGYDIKYHRHGINVGMDGNFRSLYENCSTQYTWMLSDDDILLPGALDKIMTLLNKNKLGVIYLQNIWFKDYSEVVISPQVEELAYTLYDNPLKFVERVNYWFTFISGNIFNRDLVKDKIFLEPYNGTYLMLLGWIIPAVFQGLPSCVIENDILACKANNTGGYKLFKVFGENFNLVMLELIKQGCDVGIKDIINNHLLDTFFPMFLNQRNEKFAKEKYLTSMLPVFWKYKLFWRKTFVPLVKQYINSI